MKFRGITIDFISVKPVVAPWNIVCFLGLLKKKNIKKRV